MAERPTGLVPLTAFRRRAKDAVKRAPRFWFLGAERGAPVEVKMAIARFRQLPEKVRGQMVLWGWLGGPGMTPKMKFEQSEVAYGSPPADKAFQRCGGCMHAYQNVSTGVYLCSHVKGTISLLAWCDRFAKPLPREQYAKFQEGR